MWKNGDNRTYDRVYLSASPVTSSDHVIWRKRKYELSIEWRRMHAIFGHLRNKCWTSISCLFINQLNVQFILIYTLELWHSSMCAFHAYIVRSCFHFDAHMYVHGRYEQVNMNAIPPLHTYVHQTTMNMLNVTELRSSIHIFVDALKKIAYERPQHMHVYCVCELLVLHHST